MTALQRPFTRRNYGRGHGYRDAQDRKVPGVTTILSNGLPKPALVNWAARTAAEYAVDNWAMLGDLPVSKRLAIIKDAPNASKNAAALRGTTLHAAAEAIQITGAAEVNNEQLPLVESYLRFVEEWDLDAEHVESIVCSYTHGYAGTLDLIGTLADGRRWLLDIKTSKGVFGDMALQLAAYRHADTIIDDGIEQAMPQVDAVGIVHVRADGYDLVPLVAEAPQFRAFLYVAQVAATVDSLRELVQAPLTPPTEKQEISA